MQHSDITIRLQDIKKHIHFLRSDDTTDIISKIVNLRAINGLLKEQNALLAIKQGFFPEINATVIPAYSKG